MTQTPMIIESAVTLQPGFFLFRWDSQDKQQPKADSRHDQEVDRGD